MTHLKFDDDPEAAALELILSQLAAAYRKRFIGAYPTEGEPDLRLLYSITQRFVVRQRVNVTALLRQWIIYLEHVGATGSIRGFDAWLVREQSGGQVIKFPDAPTS